MSAGSTTDDRERLMREVFACATCEPLQLGFQRPRAERGFYKFPPTIGSTGKAELLFVGINPRRSASNQRLHVELMSSFAAFSQLAANRVPDRDDPRTPSPYVIFGGPDRHYDLHLDVVSQAFGDRSEPVRFEDHAAATELFLCATTKTPPYPIGASPCAESYMARTVALVRPRVILPIGDGPARWFQARAEMDGKCYPVTIGEVRAWVVPLLHPNRRGLSKAQREADIREAVRAVKEVIRTGRIAAARPLSAPQRAIAPSSLADPSARPDRLSRGPAGRLAAVPESGGTSLGLPDRLHAELAELAKGAMIEPTPRRGGQRRSRTAPVRRWFVDPCAAWRCEGCCESG